MTTSRDGSTHTWLGEHPDGTLLYVKALPGSRENRIRGVENGRLRIAVTEVAESGKANRALTQFIARTLRVARSSVRLTNGETSAFKTFLVTGADWKETHATMETFLSEPKRGGT